MNKQTIPNTVILSLGSNLGNRELYLRQALESIAKLDGIEIQKASRVLENQALIIQNQPDFLNQILIINCNLSPYELLDQLKQIEKDLGRQHRQRYGPREIDLDILTYDTQVIRSDILKLPHPGLLDRPYLHQLFKEMNLAIPQIEASHASTKEQAIEYCS